MRQQIITQIKANLDVKQLVYRDEKLHLAIEQAISTITTAYQEGKKVLVFGNGGSAADAQHFAAEFVNMFRKARRALPAIALTTDTSSLTAIGNDSGYDFVFSRQVEAFCQKGDVVLAITTSDAEMKAGGHSVNIANGLKKAKEMGATTIGLFSIKTKKLLELTDIAIQIPATDTPRIQESHLLVEHIICDLVESSLFPE